MADQNGYVVFHLERGPWTRARLARLRRMRRACRRFECSQKPGGARRVKEIQRIERRLLKLYPPTSEAFLAC